MYSFKNQINHFFSTNWLPAITTPANSREQDFFISLSDFFLYLLRYHIYYDYA